MVLQAPSTNPARVAPTAAHPACRLRLGELGPAIGQAAEKQQVVALPALGLLGLEPEREPKVTLEIASAVRNPEVRRQYADDSADLAVQDDRLADDRRIGSEA